MKKLFLALISFFLLASKLVAQDVLTLKSNTEGLHLGVDLSLKSWTSDYFTQLNELEPRGIGFGVHLGFGINQHLEVKTNLEHHNFGLNNDWDKFSMTAVLGGIRYNFAGSLQAFRPFAGAGLAFQSFTMTPVYIDNYAMTAKMNGLMPYLDGGLNYFISPKMAIGGFVQSAFGKFGMFNLDGVDLKEKPDVVTLKIGLGFNYYLN